VRPTSVEPVKAILSDIGMLDQRRAGSPSPVTMLTTPAGSRPFGNLAKGDGGERRDTSAGSGTTYAAARAGAIFQASISHGSSGDDLAADAHGLMPGKFDVRDLGQPA